MYYCKYHKVFIEIKIHNVGLHVSIFQHLCVRGVGAPIAEGNAFLLDTVCPCWKL